MTVDSSIEVGFEEPIERERGWLRRLVTQSEIGIFSAALILFVILSFINQGEVDNKFTRVDNYLLRLRVKFR